METKNSFNSNLPGDANSQQFRFQNQYIGQNTNEGINDFDQSNVRVGSIDSNSLEPRTQAEILIEHEPHSAMDNENGDGNQDSRSDDGLNDFEEEKETDPVYKRKIYMGLVAAPSERIPIGRYGLYDLKNYLSPEQGTISVDNKEPFIYIHHSRFTEDLQTGREQRILKFYLKGLEGTKRNTVPQKDNNGKVVASLVLGSEEVHDFGGYICYPTDYQILDKILGISRIHAIILGIDSVISDHTKPMRVIDVSNLLDHSGFAIKRAKDFQIDSSTVLKAVGRGIILRVKEAIPAWVIIEGELEVRPGGQKGFEATKTHKIIAESSKTGEWIILDRLDTSTDPEDTSFVEILPYNQDEEASIARAASPKVLGWLMYDGKAKRWLVRNKKKMEEPSGLWLLSKNETDIDLGGQYTLYYEDYLMIHKHLFAISDNHKFGVF